MLVDPKEIDNKKSMIIPGDKEQTILFCVYHFITIAQESIEKNNKFSVALSGGSTPKAIFSKITASPYKEMIDWSKVYLFFSDERSVPADHIDSNYKMAMNAGFSNVPIPQNQIFRMEAEKTIEENAKKYEAQIKTTLGENLFDLVMLGMGEDGHTASLFPNTKALTIQDQLVTANYVPEKNTNRMTLTYPCINNSKHICIYVLGDSKKEMVKKILQDKEEYPISKIGTPEHKALWILDEDSSKLLT